MSIVFWAYRRINYQAYGVASSLPVGRVSQEPDCSLLRIRRALNPGRRV